MSTRSPLPSLTPCYHRGIVYRVWRWIARRLRFDVIVRRVLKWVAFRMSRQDLQNIIQISTVALAMVELRESAREAMENGLSACEPRTRAQLEQSVKDIETELDTMLERMCADMDINGDGKVSLEEAIIYLQTRKEDNVRRGDGSGISASSALTSSAISAGGLGWWRIAPDQSPRHHHHHHHHYLHHLHQLA